MSPRRPTSADGVALVPLTVKAPVDLRARADEVADREHTTRSAILLRWLNHGEAHDRGNITDSEETT